MKSQTKIFIVFLLNLFFSIIEFIGGTITNSASILSDSVHDLSDSIGILISYIFEKISKKRPDKSYSYGYIRYSLLGGLFTIILLILGSIFMIINSIRRIINPVDVNYNGMLLISIIGFVINMTAVIFTSKGKSLNQKAINLHMLEDVLGWVIIFIASIVIKITKINTIDSILSILLSIFIIVHAVKHLKVIVDIFLMKTPQNINIVDIINNIESIDGVNNVHHVHVFSIDGNRNFITMHVVTNKNDPLLKNNIKKLLKKYDIVESTIEFETVDEKCREKSCKI